MSDLDRVRAFWDRESHGRTHNDWLSHPLVREYVNELVTGSPHDWPFDWFQREVPGRRFPLGLSIGCGTGALERDVLRRGICDRIEAFDASPASLETARAEAKTAGLEDRVVYRLDDFNNASLPASRYDIVFFHQSLHHVSRLERLLRQVRRALKPGGIVYLDEFVGPSRDYWTPWTASGLRTVVELFPPDVQFDEGFLMPVQYDDWSEAVRSGEIRTTLRIGFTLRERGYGGNVLAIVFPSVRAARLSDEMVRNLIAAEKSILDSGVPSFHAVIVAEPRTGLGGALASLRYLLRPKARRIVREILRALDWWRGPRDPWEG